MNFAANLAENLTLSYATFVLDYNLEIIESLIPTNS